MNRRNFVKSILGGVASVVVPSSAWSAIKLDDEPTFTIERTEISGTPRPLKARWTVESDVELERLHGLDAEEELAQILSDEIKKEMKADMLWHNTNTNVVYGFDGTEWTPIKANN